MTEMEQAVSLLRAGRLVAFPTETVYGLGADATNSAAIGRIFAAKGRPSTNPLIVHVAGVEQARRYASDWPAAAARLAKAFWPGPLTIVVPRSPTIAPEVSAGLGTVGLRCPRHPLALELLRRFDGPVAAPSANRSTRVSPTTAQHVREELGDRVDLILDGGPCEVGIESTVVSVCTTIPTILRPGQVSPDQIRTILGDVLVRLSTVSPETPAHSPGQHLIHYSPQTPCFSYTPGDVQKLQALIAAHARDPLIILSHLTPPALHGPHHLVQMPREPEQYAQHLYAALRSADARRPVAILVELPPQTPEWLAVNDRLRRASRPIG